jgi:hypothetical protein
MTQFLSISEFSYEDFQTHFITQTDGQPVQRPLTFLTYCTEG